jgi:hypothetical protein
LLGAAFAGTSSASTPRPCGTAGLVVWLESPGSHTAGSTYYRLGFTNLSTRTCALRGFPGVSGVDLAGRRLGSPAARDLARPARTISLAPGRTAIAVVQIVDANNFGRATCAPRTAAGLRVYPPDQTTARLVPFPFLACSRPGPVYLRVRAIAG